MIQLKWNADARFDTFLAADCINDKLKTSTGYEIKFAKTKNTNRKHWNAL